MSHRQLFLLYLPITALLPALLSWYVGRNLFRPWLVSPGRVFFAIAAMFPFGLLAMLALTFWNEQDRAPISGIVEFGFVTLGYLLTAASMLLTRDVVRLLGVLAKRRGMRSSTASKTTNAAKDSWLQPSSWALLFLAVAMVWLGRRGAEADPHVRTIPTPIRRLPDSFDGYRVVHLTDIHIHASVDEARVRRLVTRANALAPDLIAITGDVVDGPMNDLRKSLQPLGELKSRDGVFVALGNHENYAGADACAAEFERLGFHVLLNEHHVVVHGLDRIVIAGVTNPQHGMHGGRYAPIPARIASMTSDPRLAIRGAPTDAPKILLAHQPESVAAARGLGFDLALAGHTHGGQFLPWNWGADLLFPYPTGTLVEGSMRVYVGHGLGTFGPPLRLGSASEIAVLELRRDD